MAKAGRKRLIKVVRDKKGKSRQHEFIEKQYYRETLERRGADLKADGLLPELASNQLSGFTLGRLLLLRRASDKQPDPMSISEEQYNTGNRWCRIIYNHARIMGYKLSVPSPSMEIGGGLSCSDEPSEDEVAHIRGLFRVTYGALMAVCRAEGSLRPRDVTYGVCVENWPIKIISREDVGKLRISLNEMGREIRKFLTCSTASTDK